MKNSGFWKYFFWLFIINVIFTSIDTVIHLNVEALEVYSYPIPSFLLGISTSPLFWYAVGKFISTLIFGAILYYFVKKGKNTFLRALTLTVPIIILLEVRYFISGSYDTKWHIYNTIMHFIVLFVSSYVVFRQSKLFEGSEDKIDIERSSLPPYFYK